MIGTPGKLLGTVSIGRAMLGTARGAAAGGGAGVGTIPGRPAGGAAGATSGTNVGVVPTETLPVASTITVGRISITPPPVPDGAPPTGPTGSGNIEGGRSTMMFPCRGSIRAPPPG